MSQLRNSARPFMRALYTNPTTRVSNASQALAYRNSLSLSRSMQHRDMKNRPKRLRTEYLPVFSTVESGK